MKKQPVWDETITVGEEVHLDFDVYNPSAWTQHVPFMAWIVSVTKPGVFVELGTHWGTSFFAACLAAQSLGHEMKSIALDLWTGDPHAGFYGEDVFDAVAHKAKSFSRVELMKSSFEKARSSVPDGSVDLLHIDGLHTYEAVRDDFNQWLPSLSDRGVVLFHDIAEYRDDFGVYKLWDELAARYPHFHFEHGHGLGVLLVGSEQSEPLKNLAAQENTQQGVSIRNLFSSLGAQLDVKRLQQEVQHVMQSFNAVNEAYNRDSMRHASELEALHASTSWKVTKPLRALKNLVTSRE